MAGCGMHLVVLNPRLALLGHGLWGIGTALVGLLWLYTLLSIVRGRFFVRG